MLLLVYSLVPLTHAIVQTGNGSLSDYTVHVCSAEDGYAPWFAIQVSLIALFLGWAAVLAFRSRNFPTA